MDDGTTTQRISDDTHTARTTCISLFFTLTDYFRSHHTPTLPSTTK